MVYLASCLGVMFLVLLILPTLFLMGDLTGFLVGLVCSIVLIAYLVYEWKRFIKDPF